MMFIMLGLVIAVIATTAGVLYWFFRRLHRIEQELWGTKRQEAEETAKGEISMDTGAAS